MRDEKVAIAHVEVGGHLCELTGNEGMAIAIDQEDCAQLRERVDDPLQTVVQAQLLASDIGIRHAAHDFVNLGGGALDRLKDLERVLMKDVERTLDPVIGEGMLMTIAQPRSEYEKHDRQHHRCGHHKLQQSDG